MVLLDLRLDRKNAPRLNVASFEAVAPHVRAAGGFNSLKTESSTAFWSQGVAATICTINVDF